MPKFCNISPAKCANCSDMTVNCCHLYNILTLDSLSDSQRLWMAKVLHQLQWCSMQYQLISISLINSNQTLWLKALVLLEVFILLLTIIGCMPQHNRSRRLACCFQPLCSPQAVCQAALTTSPWSRSKFLKQFPGISQELGSIKHDHYCSPQLMLSNLLNTDSTHGRSYQMIFSV